MEGPEYVDLFATKGFEYLLVIAFLITLVLFWRLLNRPARSQVNPAKRETLVGSLVDWFYLVDDFYYHQGHSWLRREDHDVVRVGMDDFAQKLLGRAEGIDIPRVGAWLTQGDKGWNVQVGGRPIAVLSPVNGEVVEVNEEVLNSPGLINEDPYGKGWILKVRASKLGTDVKNLLTGGLAKSWMEETVQRLRKMFAGDLGIVLQDGGIPASGIARNISREKWWEIAREFLLSD